MNVGDIVYTVDNATNKIDSWKYAGVLPTKDEFLVHLVNGKKQCFLPSRCVFKTELEARFIADSYR